MKITNKHDPIYIKACKRESAFWEGADDYANVDIPERAVRFENEKKTGNPDMDEFGYLKSLGHFPRGLSLGSGGGSYELKLLQEWIVDHFVFIDISEKALETLRNNAEALGLTDKIETHVQDFNFIKLPENTYDLISCQSMLHHIVNLEECMHMINRALMKDGIFITNECISEDKMYRSDARMAFVAAFQALITEKWMTTKEFVRTNPKVLTNNCPFECIRSQELYDIIQHYFGETAVRDVPYGHLWCWRHGYSENRSDEYFALLEKFDTFVAKNNFVLPSRLFGVYKKSQKPLLHSSAWTKKELEDNIGVNAISEQWLMQWWIGIKNRFPKLYNLLKRLYFKVR